jgi:hypothetical protein
MALISCPECKKDVSSAAVACPSCGAPIRALTQGNNAMTDANVCPMCGKTLPHKATICMDCNINVKTGKPLELPSIKGQRRTRGGKSFGPLLVIAILLLMGYWQRDFLRELLVKHGMTKVQEDTAPTISTTDLPAAPHRPLTLPPKRPSRVYLSTEGDTPTQPTSAPEPPTRQSTPSRTPQPVAREVQQPVQLVVITCPLCKGEGRLPEPGSQRWTYQCPLCSGRKSRDLRLREGQRVCNTCKGMGRITHLDDFRRTNNRYVADRCTNCQGAGVQ